jgi:hypothetical protein
VSSDSRLRDTGAVARVSSICIDDVFLPSRACCLSVRQSMSSSIDKKEGWLTFTKQTHDSIVRLLALALALALAWMFLA